MNRKGLTLVEILVGLTILGILALSFNTVFITGLESWNKARTKLEIYQNMRVVLTQMSQDLASAVAISGVPSFRGTTPAGGPDIVRFISIKEDTIYEITYRLNGTSLERTCDEHADYNFGTTDNSSNVGSSIGDVQFKYWRSDTTAWGSGGGARGNWTNNWTDTGGARYDLPQAILITLTDSEEDREFQTVVYIPASE